MSGIDDILSPFQDDEHRSDTLVEPSDGDDGAATAGKHTQRDAEKDKYEISGEVGRGGMGVILSARDTRIGREVAMKVITSGWRESRAYAERFVREAQVQGRLEHPNICPVHELGSDAEDGPYFTMKMVHGYSLAEMIKQYGDGGTHREDSMKTMTGSVVGTPAYMPPEYAKGLVEEMDERSDIYSLGALLYELLALAPPSSKPRRTPARLELPWRKRKHREKWRRNAAGRRR